MKNITITYSANIHPNISSEVESALESLGATIDSQNHYCRSEIGNPTFIQVLAEIATWELILKISVTAFLAELSKQAAQDIWKNKKKVIKALSKPIVNPLKLFVSAVSKAKEKIGNQATISIGIPFPDDYFGTVLVIQPEDSEEIVKLISIFINNLENIQNELHIISKLDNGPSGPVFIEIKDEKELLIKWFGKKELNHCEQDVIKG